MYLGCNINKKIPKGKDVQVYQRVSGDSSHYTLLLPCNNCQELYAKNEVGEALLFFLIFSPGMLHPTHNPGCQRVPAPGPHICGRQKAPDYPATIVSPLLVSLESQQLVVSSWQ